MPESPQSRCSHGPVGRLTGMKSGAEVDRPQAGGYSVETNSSIRWRIFASGSRPTPPAKLSSICCGLLVAGITQVTAGWATIHFRKNCAHDPHSNHGTLHHREPGFFAFCPDLGGYKERIEQMQLCSQLAHYALGAPVHRRRIDHPSAVLDQERKHFSQLRSVRWRKIDVKHAPCSKPDHRQLFAG